MNDVHDPAGFPGDDDGWTPAEWGKSLAGLVFVIVVGLIVGGVLSLAFSRR